jgi:hypothetical protein
MDCTSPEGVSMKRILFGFGSSLIVGGGLFAQDAPAARLGKPLLPPIVRATSEEPKIMPKAGVVEAPKTVTPGVLPMPSDSNPTLGIAPITTIPGTTIPGTTIPGTTVPGTTGPMIVGQGPTIVGPPIPQPPIPGGPIFGGAPNGLLPYEACPSPIVATPCVQPQKWYTGAEFLLWYMRDFTVPSLVTIGPAGSIGALGEPGVATLVGAGQPIEMNPRYGARVTLGYWFSPKWAIDANAFWIPTVTKNVSTSSDLYPNQIIARPFFSVNQNANFAEQISNPGIYRGNVSINSTSTLFGFDVNLRRHLWESENMKLDGIFGYRYVNLREQLDITEASVGLAGAPRQFRGIEREVYDSFETRNQFHGAQIGALYEYRYGRWTLDLRAKVSAGVTMQTVNVWGNTVAVAGGAQPTIPGGLLALDTNSGTYNRTPFAILPEGTLNIGYDITPRLKIFAGYNIMYWSSVVRPGSQIDTSLDEYRIPDFTTGRNVPPPSSIRPVTKVQPESLWVQGVNFGILFKW